MVYPSAASIHALFVLAFNHPGSAAQAIKNRWFALARRVNLRPGLCDKSSSLAPASQSLQTAAQTRVFNTVIIGIQKDAHPVGSIRNIIVAARLSSLASGLLLLPSVSPKIR
ncbi:MAG: hypothetical protein NTW32_11815 [Chloroflexi bacterium]|nr:hypothetical protein [Chloroflexota bacterium]